MIHHQQNNINCAHRFGTAGGKNENRGICVLPLNMINQKFYMLFWFWLSLLITASFFMLSVRMVMVFSTDARMLRVKYLYRVRNVEVRLFYILYVYLRHILCCSNKSGQILHTRATSDMFIRTAGYMTLIAHAQG